MLSIIIPARNSYENTRSCIESMLNSLPAVKDEVELLLIDDNSDPESRIIECFQHFSSNGRVKCRIFHFNAWQHYTGVFALGLQESVGDKIMFLSNDMLMTPYFMEAVLGVADAVPEAGIIRGTSQYCDSHPEHQCACPLPLRSYHDVMLFSAFVREYYGNTWTEDKLLSGDAVVIRRGLLDAIGNMDIRFFGYFGDLDYGIRARRAGFKLVCAKGAWLHHYGAGHIKHGLTRQEEMDERMRHRIQLVTNAYVEFRRKWGDSMLPENYCDVGKLDHDGLMRLQTAFDDKIQLHCFEPGNDFQEL